MRIYTRVITIIIGVLYNFRYMLCLLLSKLNQVISRLLVVQKRRNTSLIVHQGQTYSYDTIYV